MDSSSVILIDDKVLPDEKPGKWLRTSKTFRIRLSRKLSGAPECLTGYETFRLLQSLSWKVAIADMENYVAGAAVEYTAGLSLAMLVMFKAMERKEGQWRKLLDGAGYVIQDIKRWDPQIATMSQRLRNTVTLCYG